MFHFTFLVKTDIKWNVNKNVSSSFIYRCCFNANNVILLIHDS